MGYKAMKHTNTFGGLALAILAALAFAGCGSALHNGTEMDVTSVMVTGLPANPYAVGQVMVFSYNKGTSWVHDDATEFASARFRAAVSATGTLTYSFSPPLQITTPTLVFLLIDPNKGWNTFQLDKKHSGGKGGDATLDSTWGGAINPVTITGTVSGDSVTWAYGN
jgi:hypothetical protein